MNKNNLNLPQLNWRMLSIYRNQIYGFSIVWIMLFHIWESYGSIMDSKWVVTNIISRGNIGVDMFLFLSGVFSYFSKKKAPAKESLPSFFLRKIQRIIRIYFYVCIPYFMLLFFTGKYSFTTFVKQVFFVNKSVNSFWFLLCISICYLIYPLLFKLIETSRTYLIYIILSLYTLLLVLMNVFHVEYYAYYEILLSRIPVFIFGSLLGKTVYDNGDISPKLISGSILILLTQGPIDLIIRRVFFLNNVRWIISRYLMGLQGFAVLILFIVIIQYLGGTYIYDILGKLGSFTLEIYVIHIILRGVVSYYLNIAVDTKFRLILFSFIFVVLSIFLSYTLHACLRRRESANIR